MKWEWWLNGALSEMKELLDSGSCEKLSSYLRNSESEEVFGDLIFNEDFAIFVQDVLLQIL